MGPVVLGVAGPGLVLLLVVGLRARGELASDLALGALGGLLGTFAYDLFRLPFHLAGLRVFATISAFGLWLLDAPASSRWTEVAGWSYHFLNGITFGIMYALFMRGRHWAWAVLWGVALEGLAVASAFGEVFALRGNHTALAIAFAGHVAYGVPLGLVVWRGARVQAWMATVPAGAWAFAGILCAAALVSPLWDPARVAADEGRPPGTFAVEGARLAPAWLRLERGGTVRFSNPSGEPARIRIRPPDAVHEVPAGGSLEAPFTGGGIFQVFVETGSRSISSFVIVEPVR